MTRKTLRNLIIIICLILIAVAFLYFEWPYITGRLGNMDGNVVPGTSSKSNPEPTVAVVQSDREHADELTFDDIKSLVEEAVKSAGGLDDIISDGDVVVLKPNLVCLWINSTGEQLPPDVNGITTDWRVVKAASEIVRELNPNGKIYVMESSAFQVTRMAMDSLNYTKKQDIRT